MRKKIYIGICVLLLLTAVIANNRIMIAGSIFLSVCGVLSLRKVSSGVQYSESHYRVYKQFFFLKRGHWKSILGVRRIYIRHYVPQQKHSFLKNRIIPEEMTEQVVMYQVYFVRKSGYYKMFESNSLEIARRKANELGRKYNLNVEEKGEESQLQEDLLAQG
jgi:hypothetical protein